MPKRRNWGRELWERGLSFAQADNDPVAYECGEWTLEKLYFLSNYIAQMTQAMVGHPKFSSINYVDLFASSGLCKLKGVASRRYPGSAILAALSEKPFDRLILVENDPTLLKSLCSRIDVALSEASKTRVIPIQGDSNTKIQNVIDAIPPNSLTLAFIDPFSLDIDFDTILQMTQRRAVDLLILFADDMDLIRNVEKYYYPNIDSKLDRFLGTKSNWREKWDQLQTRDAAHLRELFTDIYLSQLRQIDYNESKTLGIPRNSRPLYRLVFASKNPLGLKFWHIAESMDLFGNRSLFSD